jgi:hypothetical protein
MKIHEMRVSRQEKQQGQPRIWKPLDYIQVAASVLNRGLAGLSAMDLAQHLTTKPKQKALGILSLSRAIL